MTQPTAQHDAPTQADPLAQERRLKRILRILVIAVLALVVLFAVVYYFGPRMQAGPTLTARSVAAAEAAVTSSPNDVGLRMSLANAYLNDHRPDDALAQYDEVLRAQPDNREALRRAGAVLYEKGDLNGAKARYEVIVKKAATGEFAAADKTLESAYYFLGSIALAQNDPKTAATNLEAALQIDQTDADAWNQLGNAQIGNGDFEAATASFDKAVAFIPIGWCDPYTGMQTAYAKLGKADGVSYAQAMTEVCKGTNESATAKLTALTEGEFKVPAYIGLALAAEHDGDNAKAIEWYRKAADADPSSISALTALARLGGNQPKSTTSPQPSASAS